jgi:hypothetical protein
VTHVRMAGLAAAALLAIGGCASSRSAARVATSGDLTKALNTYTGDEFFNLVSGLNYSGRSDRQRKCRGSAACVGGQKINVHVEAVADADSLGTGNLGRFGVIAAHAVNHGNDIEDRYGMQPGPRYSYFLVILPAAAGTASWKLEELDVQGNTRAHRTIANGSVTLCNHPYVRGARADFKTCADAAGGELMPVLFERATTRGTIDPPFWYSCASGCCEADLSRAG